MKKVLATFLCVVLCLTSLIVFASCKHECEFEKGWFYDDSHHWHACNDDLCEEFRRKGEHEFNNGYCIVCNKQSPSYVTEEKWQDALKLFEEDFSLEYTSVIDGVNSTYIVKKIKDDIYFKYGNKEEDSYYLTIEDEKFYRYEKKDGVWVKTEDFKESRAPFIDIRFQRCLYEWYSYDQEGKRFYVEHVDKALVGNGADMDDSVLEFKNGKLISLKYTLVYGSYEEEHKVKILYEDIKVEIPSVDIKD